MEGNVIKSLRGNGKEGVSDVCVVCVVCVLCVLCVWLLLPWVARRSVFALRACVHDGAAALLGAPASVAQLELLQWQ